VGVTGTLTDEHGFSLLPEPSSGDIFFDLEGDPFVGAGGREYLFGFVCENQAGEEAYESRWALTAGEEKRAFEWFVDWVMARWANEPAMRIYHFTPYEPSALKRLMGRYTTREDEIDRNVLRGGPLHRSSHGFEASYSRRRRAILTQGAGGFSRSGFGPEKSTLNR
jgi:uncharacterized protein